MTSRKYQNAEHASNEKETARGTDAALYPVTHVATVHQVPTAPVAIADAEVSVGVVGVPALCRIVSPATSLALGAQRVFTWF